MWDDSKLMGVSGTWTAKIKKIYSRGKTYAEKLSAGIDERLSLISKLEDPDNGGTERVQLMSCWLDELTLQAFENGKITEDEFSGGFVGFKSIDSVITIEEPDGALCRDANDMEAGEGDKYMCYECIKEPDIKSKEVQDAFGCAVPMDIVEIIFAPGEIPQIAIECMKLAGYMGGVEAVKN